MTPRGWSLVRAAALAAAVVLTAPVSPLALAAIPLALQLLAFRRRDPFSLALAAVLLLLAFLGIGEGTREPLWFAERAWALFAGGAFVALTAVWSERSTVLRGVLAVAAAFAAIAAYGLLDPGLLTELDWWVDRRLATAASSALGLLGDVGGMSEEQAFVRIVEGQGLLYPAALALSSLAALALSRYVMERLSGHAEALGPFREFRFSDHLVWVLVIGLALFLVPAGDAVSRLAENALLFMGGLYLVRGVAVLFWIGAATVTSGWAAALWIVAGVLLYPVAVVAALLLGLGDTWLDVRGRVAAALNATRRR